MGSTGPREIVEDVADAAVRDHDPTDLRWNWEEMPLLSGLLRVHELVDHDRYCEFVREWADTHRGDLTDRLVTNGQDYCGAWGPGFTVLQLYAATGEERYRDMGEQVVGYVRDNAARLDCGAFGHDSVKWPRELFADTLYMAVPLFAALSAVSDDPTLFREASRQLHLAGTYLQDDRTGLFDHHYDERTGERNGVAWGRANGWMLMSYAEALRRAPEDAPFLPSLRHQFGRGIQGMMAHQDPDSGRWRTVVDRPGSYLETSGSAMTVFAAAEADRRGLLTLPYGERIDRAWAGVAETVDDAGRVQGTSEGTGPSTDPTAYEKRERGRYPWGTGAVLLAGGAMTERG